MYALEHVEWQAGRGLAHFIEGRVTRVGPFLWKLQRRSDADKIGVASLHLTRRGAERAFRNA